MKAKFIYETTEDVLKPKDTPETRNIIQVLKTMHDALYDDELDDSQKIIIVINAANKLPYNLEDGYIFEPIHQVLGFWNGNHIDTKDALQVIEQELQWILYRNRIKI